MRVHAQSETNAFHPAAGKARRHRRQRFPIGRKFGEVAVPQRILILRADLKIVAHPAIALAINRHLASRAHTAAREF